MTQDQYGQARSPGYVIRGQVVQGDQTEEPQAERTTPMTRFQKVASALRGDRPDRATPDQAAGGDALDGQQDAYLAFPGEGSSVRSPDAGNRDYWGDRDYRGDEDDSRETGPEGAPAQDPSIARPDMYGTTARTDTGTVSAPYPGGSQADTAVGYGSQAGTAAGHGSPAGTVPDRGNLAGTAAGYGSQADTAADPPGLAATGVGAAEAGAAGKHAGAAADAGLRPGEATDRLGDFGDIAFGNLLPDAGEYTARWKQIQFQFVDDPQGSVTEAADVISQVTAKLEAAIQERQRRIEERQQAIQERASALRGRWGEGSNADTETLRETLRMYRAFMDQLIGPKA